MANETLSGYCPTPFLQESLFPSKGGCTLSLASVGPIAGDKTDRVLRRSH